MVCHEDGDVNLHRTERKMVVGLPYTFGNKGIQTTRRCCVQKTWY
jgi:hypothetical protein